MSERGSVFSGLTIAVLIGLVVVTITVIPLFTTADKVDNKTKVAAQTAVTDFVNEACSKGDANEQDFNKMIQTITSGLNTYSVDIEVSVLGENPEKKQLATTKRIGENVYTIYYTSQVEDVWKNNGGKFLINEGDKVHVVASTSSSALDQNANTDKIIAEATATCTVNGKN